jgi:predicted SprT family Zn-dependent metalloprotease
MEPRDAATTARQLMDLYGLKEWRFVFDNAKRRFGCCNYHTRTISLSRHLTKLNTSDDVTNTVLHEIAHALAGRAAGHGRAWKVQAEAVGCMAERCYDSDVVLAPPPQFIGTCPSCKRTVKRHRRNRIACSACCKAHTGGRFDSRFLFAWARVDTSSQ